MSDRNYWFVLFSGLSWQEFIDAGANVYGVKERRRNTLNRVKKGDYLICYLTGLSRFVGILEVQSEPYKDRTPIWSFADFPLRLKVDVVVSLTPKTAVPIESLRDRLTIFEGLKNPSAWAARVRNSLIEWKPSDGKIVLETLLKAKKNPISLPTSPHLLRRLPQT